MNCVLKVRSLICLLFSAGPSEFSASIGFSPIPLLGRSTSEIFAFLFFLVLRIFDKDDEIGASPNGIAEEDMEDDEEDSDEGNLIDDDDNDNDDDNDDDDDGDGLLRLGSSEDEDDLVDEEKRQEEVQSVMKALQESSMLEMEKAKNVEMQNKLWQRLLGIRIKMQGALKSANVLPGPDDADDLRMSTGEQLRNDIVGGIEVLASLRAALMGRHPDLVSDPIPAVLSGATDSDLWWTWMAQSNAATREAEAKVVHSCNERANLQSGRALKSFGRPLMEQIGHSLLHDREKLVKRTQLNRSGAPPLRSKRAREGTKHEPYHDDNIFDDSEFYGQLLKAFLESSSVTTGGKVMARDTRVKKTRLKKAKISMAIQDKLLNFMAPTASNILPPMADALFGSLFGQIPQNRK
jgi:protein AATF/BFR2